MVWKSPIRINYTAWFPYPDVFLNYIVGMLKVEIIGKLC